MASDKTIKFVCETEDQERFGAFELLQEVGRLVRSQRHQFVMTKTAKPNGGFVFAIETNGFTVTDVKPPVEVVEPKKPAKESAKDSVGS